MHNNLPFKRVVVIGTSCSGKTTFSSRLAKLIGGRHIELDALFWQPNWKMSDLESFRARVREAVSADAWVVDGNYNSRVHDIVWSRAEAIVWLDLPLRKVLTRFLKRSFTRSWRKEILWDGCQENLTNNIFSRDSLFLWILKTHKKNARVYSEVTKNPPEGLKAFRLSTDEQMDEFFRNLQGESE